MGGGTAARRAGNTTTEGLSPRGRGNRRAERRHRADHRSIPAWAGEPRRPPSGSSPPPVYPRVGGGTNGEVGAGRRILGLSPRGRGNLHHRCSWGTSFGSIPAWAGEPASLPAICPRWWVYPRVGGGTRPRAATSIMSRGLSPRGRGNRDEDRAAPSSQGSIPAWAGEPS